jgi:hypothetical protein
MIHSNPLLEDKQPKHVMSIVANSVSKMSFAEFLLQNVVVRLSTIAPNANFPLNVSTTTLCAQYDNIIPPATTITVPCAASQVGFLYVIVQTQNLSSTFCLADVKVYGGE